MKDLLVIVPTRSRPHNVLPVVEAWIATGAFEAAELLFAIDYDDPVRSDYLREIGRAGGELGGKMPAALLRHAQLPHHLQLVPKLNTIATARAEYYAHFALGFAGDDHRPRTVGWAQRYLEELRQLGSGIVYPDDGYQHERIPTSWAMTADIVRALSAMVPAPVEHLYCDNAIRDLGEAAGCLRYLPDVLVEHLHPVAGKADDDEQYQRVNSRPQFRADRKAYRGWQRSDLPRQVGMIMGLRNGGIAR